MSGCTAAVLSECEIDRAGFSSRAANSSMLLSADLILTAGREQRAACVTLAPATVRRTFTLRQFTRLAAAVQEASEEVSVPGRLRGLADRVSASRHLVPNVPAEMDDLPDPVDQPIEAFRECAEEIWQSLGTIIGVISVP